MNTSIIAIALGLIGLCLGSFAGATVWRLRARQLRQDEADGEEVSKTAKHEVAKLEKRSIVNDRSVCLHCGHQLHWYDLVPLVSWATLKGKCRYCHKSIGNLEPMIEIGMAAFFIVSYLFWPTPLSTPLEISHLVIWLVGGVGLVTLFVYDAKWFLLPNLIVFPLLGLGAVNALLILIEHKFAFAEIMNVVNGCAVLSGLYYLIYVLSRHQWVGFGDVKLGLVLALFLADWQLSVLALFLANAFGTLVFLPYMMSGKIQRQAHIPFGPLLISGWFVAGLFGTRIISWYLLLALGVS